MARQKTFLKFTGRIGDLSFYKAPDGFMVREKGGVPAERIANDPAFARTRENGAEFGRAGVAGRLLRSTMKPLIRNASDRLATGRLTKQMVKVLQEDTSSPRGQRNIADGNPLLLQGFEFNKNARLAATFLPKFTTQVDRTTGELKVVIPPFIPQDLIAYPDGTTHFKIVSAGSEVDFIGQTTGGTMQESAVLVLDNTPTAAITLTNTVTAGTTKTVFISLGIEFYQSVNGVEYSLNDGKFNALQLVKVDVV